MQVDELKLPRREYFQLEEPKDQILYSQQGSKKKVYKKHGTNFVVKRSKLNSYTQNQLKICKEVINKKPQHIVQIYDTWKKQGYFYFILMKYYPYTLHTYLIKRKEFLDKNPELRFEIILQIIYALIQLGCMHRDLKLDNILVQELLNNKIKVVLIDFNTCNHGQALNLSRIGTYNSMAPQIMFMRNGQVSPYTRIVDMWSLGIIVYKIFMGVRQQPYNFKFDPCSSRSSQYIQFKSQVKENNISIDKQLPQMAKYLIRQMLMDEPNKRISLILILTKLKQTEIKQIYDQKNINSLTESQKKLKQYYQKQVQIEKMEKNTLKTIQKIKSYYEIYKQFKIKSTWIWENQQFLYNKFVGFVHKILQNMIIPYRLLEKKSKIKKTALEIIVFGSKQNMQLAKMQEITLKKQLENHVMRGGMHEKQLQNYDFLKEPMIRKILIKFMSDQKKVDEILKKYKELNS